MFKSKILITSLVSGLLLFTGCSSKENKIPEELKNVQAKKSSFFGDNVYYDRPMWMSKYKKEGVVRTIGVSPMVFTEDKKPMSERVQLTYAVKNGSDKIAMKISNLIKDYDEAVKKEIISELKEILNRDTVYLYRWIDSNRDFYVLVEVDKRSLSLKLESIFLKHGKDVSILEKLD